MGGRGRWEQGLYLDDGVFFILIFFPFSILIRQWAGHSLQNLGTGKPDGAWLVLAPHAYKSALGAAGAIITFLIRTQLILPTSCIDLG